MPLSTSQVILYAADTVDYEIALAAAASAYIPISNVIGDFATAYNYVASGNYLVIAVGGPANNALFYNPCGWAGYPAGTTPFYQTSSYPVDSLPGANIYENAAGSDRTSTMYLATVTANYAVNGVVPTNWNTRPTQVSPVNTCSGSTSVTCQCPCTTASCGSQLSPDTFNTIYGTFADWASGVLGIPLALVVTQWYLESGKGSVDICSGYNNPANYGVSGPQNPYPSICAGANSGYIQPMSNTSLFSVSASDANGRTAARYISDAFYNGYTIPPTNGYGSIPGAGTPFPAGFQAACAAMGAMGWAQSNYYTSGDSPQTAGNILMNWYNDYFTSLISNTTIGSGKQPSCCS